MPDLPPYSHVYWPKAGSYGATGGQLWAQCWPVQREKLCSILVAWVANIIAHKIVITSPGFELIWLSCHRTMFSLYTLVYTCSTGNWTQRPRKINQILSTAVRQHIIDRQRFVLVQEFLVGWGRVELVVDALLGHKLWMRSDFNDSAVFQDNDTVSILYRRQTVSNNDTRPAFLSTFQGLLHHLITQK